MCFGHSTPPMSWYSRCAHIRDGNRHTFCQMMQYADHLIGEMVAAVERKGIMDDTVFVFASDNGGSNGNGRGQQLPLRGRKSSKFEGGIRTMAFLYGGYIDRHFLETDSSCDYNNLFYLRY